MQCGKVICRIICKIVCIICQTMPLSRLIFKITCKEICKTIYKIWRKICSFFTCDTICSKTIVTKRPISENKKQNILGHSPVCSCTPCMTQSRPSPEKWMACRGLEGVVCEGGGMGNVACKMMAWMIDRILETKNMWRCAISGTLRSRVCRGWGSNSGP